MLHAVKVYGVGHCPRTVRTVSLLEAMNVRFDLFDLAADKHAAAWVQWRTGDALTPTVMVGLSVLADPTEQQLRAAVALAKVNDRVPSVLPPTLN